MSALNMNGRYLTSSMNNAANAAKNTGISMMNRVRSFFGKTKNTITQAMPTFGSNTSMNMNNASGSGTKMWLMGVFGIVIVLFLLLVLYNETIGTYVSDGFNKLVELVRGGTDIKVDLDPGLTGTPAVSVDVTDHTEPEPAPPHVPEPVTVSTPQDQPPTDSIDVAPEDRPAGMPGALTTSLTGSMGSVGSVGSVAESVVGGPEVFNVSPNIYTFNDAAAVCAAVGGELASYEQVKEAHAKGADWCNYGWIKGQMAVYPTQEATYEKLQLGAPEWRNACGKPGVNGGYFDNPELRFGVNCYGVKPAQKASDMILDSQVALPQTPAEIEFEKRVQKFRDQMDTASVLPFTKGQWNQ